MPHEELTAEVAEGRKEMMGSSAHSADFVGIQPLKLYILPVITIALPHPLPGRRYILAFFALGTYATRIRMVGCHPAALAGCGRVQE